MSVLVDEGDRVGLSDCDVYKNLSFVNEHDLVVGSYQVVILGVYPTTSRRKRFLFTLDDSHRSY